MSTEQTVGAGQVVVPGYTVEDIVGERDDRRLRLRGRRAADGLEADLMLVDLGSRAVSTTIREIAQLARIRHDHLVRIYDVIPVLTTSARPAVVVACGPVDGFSLETLLNSVDGLSPGEVVTVVAPIARALAAVHSAGVVHGNLGVTSVRVDTRGRPVLLDLALTRGVARSRQDAAVGSTSPVPELAEGLPATADTDVYLLGLLLRRCLDGPEGHAAPAAMLDLIRQCCAEEPADRPSPDDVAARLVASVRAEPVALRSPQTVPDVRSALRVRQAFAAAEGDSRVALRRRSRGRRGRWVLGFLVAGLMIALALPAVMAMAGLLTPPPDVESGAEPVQRVRPVPEHGHPSPGPTTEVLEPAEGVDAATLPDLATVRALIAARAAAWNEGDPAGLDAALAEGSPAREVDQDELTRAIREGYSYDGLQFSVVAADVVPYAGHELQERACAQLQIAVEEYRVALPDGSSAAIPEEVVEVRVVLSRTADGDWRVWSWREHTLTCANSGAREGATREATVTFR